MLDDSRNFRTPAHPDVLAALGRAVFNFLALEEQVTAVLHEAGHLNVSPARGMMAGQKAAELRRLADRYRGANGDASIATTLDEARAAFDDVRQRVRNELLHAHPFTSIPDEQGNFVPGLGYTVADGSSWKTLATGPQDLLDLAAEIETAINPLAEAREAVNATPPPN